MTSAAVSMDDGSTEGDVAVDPALPQLPAALDPATMVGVFRETLGSRGRFGFADCVVDRVRYRREVRAVIQYTVRLADASSDEGSDQRITALLYPSDRSRQVWRKLLRGLPGGGHRSVSLPPVAFAPDLDLILQVFPFDRRLPALPNLLHPERLRPQLPPAPSNGTWISAPVRYRAGLCCTLRWHVHDRAGDRCTWYVKGYRDDQGSRTYEDLVRLASAGIGLGFRVPVPAAYLAEHRALMVKEVSGPSLAELLLTGEDASAFVGAAASALAAFHRGPILPRWLQGRSEVLDEARRSALLVSWVRPTLAGAAMSLVGRITQELEEVPPRPVHGDLKPDHVLWSEDGPTLLDLDTFSAGDPVGDVASMMGRLTGMVLRQPGDGARIQTARDAFAKAYFTLVPSAWGTRLPAHHAGALLREAAGCYRQQLPSWPRLMDELVELAARALASG